MTALSNEEFDDIQTVSDIRLKVPLIRQEFGNSHYIIEYGAVRNLGVSSNNIFVFRTQEGRSGIARVRELDGTATTAGKIVLEIKYELPTPD